jgi:hypothetical protein
MKAPAQFDFLNLRKPVSHITFFIFSLLVTGILVLTDKFSGPLPVKLSVFILLFSQLEVFVYFGNRLFLDLNFDQSPEEITRIIIVRFMGFLAACLITSMILYVLTQYLGLLLQGEDMSNVVFNFIHFGLRNWFKSTITGF